MRISDWSSDVCSSDLQSPGIARDIYGKERADILACDASILIVALKRRRMFGGRDPVARPEGRPADRGGALRAGDERADSALGGHSHDIGRRPARVPHGAAFRIDGPAKPPAVCKDAHLRKPDLQRLHFLYPGFAE